MHQAYLEAIKRFEGFTQQGAWDYKQISNGYGTRAKHVGEVIDHAEADRRFGAEIEQANQHVRNFAPSLDAGTQAALTSLTYNAGTSWMRDGLGEAVKRGDLERAMEIFKQYTNAGGRSLPGLVARREAEVAWFGAGDLGGDLRVIAEGCTRERVNQATIARTRETQQPAEATAALQVPMALSTAYDALLIRLLLERLADRPNVTV